MGQGGLGQDFAAGEKGIGEMAWAGAIRAHDRALGILHQIGAPRMGVRLGPERWKVVEEKTARLPAGATTGTPGSGPK